MKVLGSAPELGGWKPAHALTLCTSDAQEPFWRGGTFIDPALLEAGQSLEYKYILVSQTHPGAQASHWESIGGNRSLNLSNASQVEVQDTFGEKRRLRMEIYPDGPAETLPSAYTFNTEILRIPAGQVAPMPGSIAPPVASMMPTPMPTGLQAKQRSDSLPV